MELYKYPGRLEWGKLLARPVFDSASLEETVRTILQEVKSGGDGALKRFTLQFDKVSIQTLPVSEEEMEAAGNLMDEGLKQAILLAKNNIEKFHQSQVQQEIAIETMPGIHCWRKSVPIQRVGLYIPGGTAPLFSTILMLGIPAQIAGCEEIILCSPPDSSGKLNPAILYTAGLVGVTRIFKVGGAQAIAAMAYGTASIPRVYKIFGPGNQYVTCAKQLIQNEGMAIDMPAGPSEVCVLADELAKPSFVAADLLSQAEHGADSQVLLVTTSEMLAGRIETEISNQLDILPRKELAAKALSCSKIILVNDMQEGIDLVNEYAAEHLIINCKDDEAIAGKIINAGSVFLGNYSPESVGDYASGTNHTLPTNGYAKTYSGVSVDSFVKKITYQKLDEEGLRNIAATVELMASAEGMDAHRNAVVVRLKR